MKKRTEEEYLENCLKNVREEYINEPTRFFEIGKAVQYGSCENTTVLQSFDEGKIYKIMIVHSDERKIEERGVSEIQIVPWHNLEPFQTEKDFKHLPIYTKEDDIRMQTMQCDIGSLRTYYYHFGVDMDIDYQRGNVWTIEDKILLINSIFNNIEIGKFAMVRRPFEINQKGYEMLDGKQRLTALIEFNEGRFTYNGKTYYELHPQDKYHFDGYPITLLLAENMTQEQKYRYFLKLNTSGKPQDPKHIKKVASLLEKELNKKGETK